MTAWQELIAARERLFACQYEPLKAALAAEVDYWEHRVSRCSRVER